MNVEELKTAIGHLQVDLRGNWGWKPVYYDDVIRDKKLKKLGI